MKNNIIIFGSGGHAKVVFWEIFELKKFNILGFVDDLKKKNTCIVNYKEKKFFTLGKISELSKIRYSGIIGVGDNHTRNKIYQQVILLKKKIKWETIVSNHAIVSKDVKIGEGTVIMSGCIIKNGTSIGRHCIINTSTSLDHDNIIEDFSSTGPSVTTGGGALLKKFSHIGIGSVVKQKISIGTNVVIGGNSFVNKNCQKNLLYFGNPIKKIKKIKIPTKYL